MCGPLSPPPTLKTTNLRPSVRTVHSCRSSSRHRNARSILKLVGADNYTALLSQLTPHKALIGGIISQVTISCYFIWVMNVDTDYIVNNSRSYLLIKSMGKYLSIVSSYPTCNIRVHDWIFNCVLYDITIFRTVDCWINFLWLSDRLCSGVSYWWESDKRGPICR